MTTRGDRTSRPGDRLPALHIDSEVVLTQPLTIKTYDYWRACRGGRLMPTRADITPKGMKDFMTNVGLIEARPTALGVDYVVRLAGSRCEEVFGPISGKSLSDFLPPEIEVRWRRVCEEVRRTRGPLSVTGRIAFPGKDWLQSETFVGPLGAEGQEITMLLLGFVAWPALSGIRGTGPA
jgi:hypothetical protein